MAGFAGGEILDHGSAPSPRRRTMTLVITMVIASGLALAALAAGLTWWSGRPPVSDALAIVGMTVTSSTRVTVVAEPPIGALATPSGTALPGVILRLRVGGDPGDSVEVVPATTDSIVYVEEGPAVTIAPGGFADVDVTVAPVDCALAREGTELLTTVDGAVVPLTEDVRASFAAVLVRACDGAGTEPLLTVTAARRGGQPPLQTIGLFVDVTVDIDASRLVLTPLDGPGLRGLGAADRRSGKGIPLLWLVAPGAESRDDAPTAYTQVFVVRDGTAYPWVVGIPITEDLPEMTPLTTSVR